MPNSFDAPEFNAAAFYAPELEPADDSPLKDVAITGNFSKDAKAELSAMAQAFRDRAKAEQLRRDIATDSEYWVCLCFTTREQKEEFLRKAGIADDKYIVGREAAEKLGIKIETPDPEFGKQKIDKTWAEFPSI